MREHQAGSGQVLSAHHRFFSSPHISPVRPVGILSKASTCVAANLDCEVLRWSPDDKQRIGEPVQQFASDKFKSVLDAIVFVE